MTTRTIVRVDEEKCDGCGNCVSPCAEGALQIIDGKAGVIREELCDGAGFCLGVCPNGALSIEEREAAEFSEQAVEKQAASKRRGNYQPQQCYRCGRDEESAVLFPCRRGGKSLWVFARCLPGLIHG
jgi:MinD superfamily P-loop ATPase